MANIHVYVTDCVRQKKKVRIINLNLSCLELTKPISYKCPCKTASEEKHPVSIEYIQQLNKAQDLRLCNCCLTVIYVESLCAGITLVITCIFGLKTQFPK